MSAVPLTARLRHEIEVLNRQQAEARRTFAKAVLLNSITAQGARARREMQELVARSEEARIRARHDPDLLAEVVQVEQDVFRGLGEVLAT